MTIVFAIIVGLVVGALGRLVVPGKQAIGLVLTLAIGLVGSFVGLLLAEYVFGISSVVLTLVLQVVIAALLVFLVAGGSKARSKV